MAASSPSNVVLTPSGNVGSVIRHRSDDEEALVATGGSTERWPHEYLDPVEVRR